MCIIPTCHPYDGEDNGGLMPLFNSHGGGLLCSVSSYVELKVVVVYYAGSKTITGG